MSIPVSSMGPDCVCDFIIVTLGMDQKRISSPLGNVYSYHLNSVSELFNAYELDTDVTKYHDLKSLKQFNPGAFDCVYPLGRLGFDVHQQMSEAYIREFQRRASAIIDGKPLVLYHLRSDLRRHEAIDIAQCNLSFGIKSFFIVEPDDVKFFNLDGLDCFVLNSKWDWDLAHSGYDFGYDHLTEKILTLTY